MPKNKTISLDEFLEKNIWSINPRSGITRSGHRIIKKSDYPDLTSFQGRGYQLEVPSLRRKAIEIDFDRGIHHANILDEKGKKTGLYLSLTGLSTFQPLTEEQEEAREFVWYELIDESLELNVLEAFKKQVMPWYNGKRKN